MLRGPKGLTPGVDLRCHQYPENGLQVWGEAFTPKSPFVVSKKHGVTKLAFIYVKRAKGKNNVINQPMESNILALLA